MNYLHAPWRMCKMLIILTKEGSWKLHVIFYYCPEYAISHNRCLYTPQDKIITEFIKMTPFKSLHTLES